MISNGAETERQGDVGPAFAVVIPARQAAAYIGRCIDAVRSAGFRTDEICVVDDASSDSTGAAARAQGVRTLSSPVPVGAAGARNMGVASTQSDIVLFVDADVLLHPGARHRLEGFFREHVEFDAVFGSYDDSPESTRPVSRYRNLLHHYVHQTGRPEAATFWTGFGAVRRAAFEGIGGFDPDLEAMEDIDLGVRLRAAGRRIRLDRSLLCKHLKDWTVTSMFLTDWKRRAVPWSRLLARQPGVVRDLNVSLAHRASGALVFLMIVAVAGGVLIASLLWLALGGLAAFLVLNARFLLFLRARCGLPFAVQSIAFHVLHYVAADLGYLQVRLLDGTRQPRLRRCCTT